MPKGRWKGRRDRPPPVEPRARKRESPKAQATLLPAYGRLWITNKGLAHAWEGDPTNFYVHPRTAFKTPLWKILPPKVGKLMKTAVRQAASTKEAQVVCFETDGPQWDGPRAFRVLVTPQGGTLFEITINLATQQPEQIATGDLAEVRRIRGG